MSTQYSGRAAMMAKMASMAGSLRDDGAAPVRPRERASDGRTHPRPSRPIPRPVPWAHHDPARLSARGPAAPRAPVAASSAPPRAFPDALARRFGIPRVPAGHTPGFLAPPCPPAPLAFPIVTVPALTNPRFKNIHFFPRRSCAT